MKSALPLLAALLMSAVAGGCGGDEEESAADPSSLEGVPWVLVSGVDVDGWEEAAYLAALPTAVGFRVSGGLLELLSAEGSAVVTYTRGERR